jgi:hypothetical protein
VDNRSIHNVEGDNRLSPGVYNGRQPGSMLVENLSFFQSAFAIVFSRPGNYFVVFYKIKHSSFKHIRVVSG